MLNMDLSGRRKRGRHRRWFRDVVKEDMQKVGVTEDNVRDWVRWMKALW